MNDRFPHESTGDQFFSESQFESYRKLGYTLALKLGSANATYPTMADFFTDVAART